MYPFLQDGKFFFDFVCPILLGQWASLFTLLYGCVFTLPLAKKTYFGDGKKKEATFKNISFKTEIIKMSFAAVMFWQ